MNNLLEFRKQNCEMIIKATKRALFTQRGLTYLNMAIAAFNCYLIYHYPMNIFTTLCTGAIIGNVVWCLAHLQWLKQDLKFEKQLLNRILEWEAQEEHECNASIYKRFGTPT